MPTYESNLLQRAYDTVSGVVHDVISLGNLESQIPFDYSAVPQEPAVFETIKQGAENLSQLYLSGFPDPSGGQINADLLCVGTIVGLVVLLGAGIPYGIQLIVKKTVTDQLNELDAVSSHPKASQQVTKYLR